MLCHSETARAVEEPAVACGAQYPKGAPPFSRFMREGGDFDFESTGTLIGAKFLPQASITPPFHPRSRNGRRAPI